MTEGRDNGSYDALQQSGEPRAQPKVSEWQPISTAPKDGTRVLLWSSGSGGMGVTWPVCGEWCGTYWGLDAPCMQLAADLAKAGTPAALSIRQRHLNGEFDASMEESDAWAAGPDGQAALNSLSPNVRKIFEG